MDADMEQFATDQAAGALSLLFHEQVSKLVCILTLRYSNRKSHNSLKIRLKKHTSQTGIVLLVSYKKCLILNFIRS